jgi:hypothetical protein
MGTLWIWALACLAYAAFLAWYRNWRGPLSAAEAEDYLARMQAQGIGETGRNELETMRAFLMKDDGRAFLMLNLVKVSSSLVQDPKTGALAPAAKVLDGYTRVFLPALFARGGHPALVARKVGGYFDAWGVEADPGWSIVGVMRYRSRRDLAELVLMPQFTGAHDFKHAAMPATFSFPTQVRLMGSLSPTVAVGLVLALVAALVQVALLTGST